MLACKQTSPSPSEVQPTSRHVKVKAGGDEQLSYSGYPRNVFLKMKQSGFAGHLLLVSPSLYRHCLPCLHYFASAKLMIYSYKMLLGLESASSAVWTCQFAGLLMSPVGCFLLLPAFVWSLCTIFMVFFCQLCPWLSI